MATPAKVIHFPSGTAVPDRAEPIFKSISAEHESGSGDRIQIDDLYPEMVAVRPELPSSLRLLSRAEGYLTEATSVIETDEIRADDAVQRFQSLLPQLFSYREIGDGFAGIVNALMSALENQRGVPLSRQQIEIVRTLISKIRSEPFLKLEQATDEIMRLEDNGFVVEPAEFEVLADWLANE